jgi:hypothetical protein
MVTGLLVAELEIARIGQLPGGRGHHGERRVEVCDELE